MFLIVCLLVSDKTSLLATIKAIKRTRQESSNTFAVSLSSVVSSLLLLLQQFWVGSKILKIEDKVFILDQKREETVTLLKFQGGVGGR